MSSALSLLMRATLLQDFAWTEDQLPERTAERNALIEDPAHHGAPMFCFASAIRLFCWACVAYGYSKVSSSNSTASQDSELTLTCTTSQVLYPTPVAALPDPQRGAAGAPGS